MGLKTSWEIFFASPCFRGGGPATAWAHISPLALLADSNHGRSPGELCLKEAIIEAKVEKHKSKNSGRQTGDGVACLFVRSIASFAGGSFFWRGELIKFINFFDTF